VVFGQADLTGALPNQGQDYPSANTLSAPRSIWVDGRDTLWVADWYNSRVLWWNNDPLAQLTAAPMGSWAIWCSLPMSAHLQPIGGLNQPCGLSVSGTTLWVADQFNSRYGFFFLFVLKSLHILPCQGFCGMII